jgi:hypothetical protein
VVATGCSGGSCHNSGISFVFEVVLEDLVAGGLVVNVLVWCQACSHGQTNYQQGDAVSYALLYRRPDTWKTRRGRKLGVGECRLREGVECE